MIGEGDTHPPRKRRQPPIVGWGHVRDNTAQHFTSLRGVVDAQNNVLSPIRRRARAQNRRLYIAYFEYGDLVCWHAKDISALRHLDAAFATEIKTLKKMTSLSCPSELSFTNSRKSNGRRRERKDLPIFGRLHSLNHLVHCNTPPESDRGQTRASATGRFENVFVQETSYLLCRARGCRRRGLLRARMAASDRSHPGVRASNLRAGIDRKG